MKRLTEGSLWEWKWEKQKKLEKVLHQVKVSKTKAKVQKDDNVKLEKQLWTQFEKDVEWRKSKILWEKRQEITESQKSLNELKNENEQMKQRVKNLDKVIVEEKKKIKQIESGVAFNNI